MAFSRVLAGFVGIYRGGVLGASGLCNYALKKGSDGVGAYFFRQIYREERLITHRQNNPRHLRKVIARRLGLRHNIINRHTITRLRASPQGSYTAYQSDNMPARARAYRATYC